MINIYYPNREWYNDNLKYQHDRVLTEDAEEEDWIQLPEEDSMIFPSIFVPPPEPENQRQSSTGLTKTPRRTGKTDSSTSTQQKNAKSKKSKQQEELSDTSSDTSSKKSSHAKKKNPTPSKSLQDTTSKNNIDMNVKNTSKYQPKTSSNKNRKPSTTNDTKQNTSSYHSSSSQVSNKAKKRKIKKAASASSSNLPTTTKKQKVSTTTISTTQPLYTFQYHSSTYMNMCPLINFINLFKFMQCENTVQRLLPFITQQNCQHYNKKEYPLTKPENFLKCCLRLVQDKYEYKCVLKHEKSS